MFFLRKYGNKYGKLFFVSIFFVTIEALADLTLPTIMAHVIDVGVKEGRLDYVLQMGGYMLLITGIGAVAACCRNIVASRASQAFGTELRSDLYRKIQSLDIAGIDRFERASLITRLTSDVTQVQHFMHGMMRIFVKAPLLCIGALIMAVRLNPALSLVLVAVVPIVGLLIAWNMKVGFPRFMRVQKALDQVNRVLREYLSGVRVVKAFNRFDHEEDKFQEANGEYRERSTQVMRLMSFFNPAVMLTVNLGIAAVIWFGGLRVDAGLMPVGHIIAFINYMTQILFALMTIFMVFHMFVRAKASASRIGEVFSEVNSLHWKEGVGGSEAESKNKGRVDFEQVTFSYDGPNGSPVLKAITFTCHPGETVGIIGSTGSGKSTLVSLIPRFYDADSGTVKVDGTDVRDTDPKLLREKIAIVPQKTVLFSGTIRENLKWGKEDASQEELEAAARMAEAADFVSALPDAYETRLGQRGVNLSGGQKQRLSIARALLRKPDILILDDCTSAVDMETEARIKASLKAYARGLTCLLIAQRITSVMDADRILVLDEGERVGFGTHEELLQSCKVYREIYRSQLGKEAESDVRTGIQ